MILTVHILAGAFLAAKIKFFPLVCLAAFLSHYFLDFLTHRWSEYSIKNIRAKRWEKSLPDFLKVGLDIAAGISMVVFLFPENIFISLIAAFFAILPDGFTLLYLFFPGKLLEAHYNFHMKIQN